jgi:hypothetical protein
VLKNKAVSNFQIKKEILEDALVIAQHSAVLRMAPTYN